MIRLIGFDLDDTLFDATTLASQARIGGLRKIQDCGLHFKMQEGITSLFDIVKEFGSNYTKHYDTLLERMKTDPKKYGIASNNFSIPKFVAAGIMGYHEVKVKEIKPFDDIIYNLDKLQDLGYKIILISDGLAVKQYEKLIRLGILEYFSEVFISEEIGLKKPSPKFYQYCIETMGASPSESMYIGDRLDHDIEPAKEIGMHTILIHRGGKYDPSSMKIDQHDDIQPEYEINSLDEIFLILKSQQMIS